MGIGAAGDAEGPRTELALGVRALPNVALPAPAASYPGGDFLRALDESTSMFELTVIGEAYARHVAAEAEASAAAVVTSAFTRSEEAARASAETPPAVATPPAGEVRAAAATQPPAAPPPTVVVTPPPTPAPALGQQAPAAPAPAPAPSQAARIVLVADLEAALAGTSWPPELWPRVINIALCESGADLNRDGRYDAVNTHALGGGGLFLGVMQIHRAHRFDQPFNLFDLHDNLEAAYVIWARAGGSFGPWGCRG